LAFLNAIGQIDRIFNSFPAHVVQNDARKCNILNKVWVPGRGTNIAMSKLGSAPIGCDP
jgi:hypothetical protein